MAAISAQAMSLDMNKFENRKGAEMKRIAIAGLVLVASMVLGSSGWAQSEVSQQGVAPDLRANSFFNIKGSISTPATLPSGACSGGTAGFSAQCATGHTCSCDEDEGAKFLSTVIGKGTANVFITIDGTAGYGLPVVSDPTQPSICHPFVAEIDVTLKNDSEELEAVGGVCLGQTTYQFGGAFGLEKSAIFTDGAAPFILVEQSSDSFFKMPFTGSYVNFE
jgi:hypothetical protein